jgi:predicted lipoprotein with Yx(FWY)xxD motif
LITLNGCLVEDAMKLSSMAFLTLALSFTGCTLGDEYSSGSERGYEANYVSSESSSYMRSTSAGDIMTTPDGRTVYTYTKEAKGSPSCFGECAEEWYPVLASKNAKPFGDLTIVERIDGTRQWAYQDRPLYLYHEDQAPGDVKGDNKEDGSWHTVK